MQAPAAHVPAPRGPKPSEVVPGPDHRGRRTDARRDRLPIHEHLVHHAAIVHVAELRVDLRPLRRAVVGREDDRRRPVFSIDRLVWCYDFERCGAA